MRVICKANDGSALRPDSIQAGFTARSIFPTSVGKEYSVVGMGIWKSKLELLLKDDFGKPNMFPAELFEFKDRKLPDWWEFAWLNNANALDALWGYPELLSVQYFESLFERVPEALSSFDKEALRVERAS